MSSRAPRPWAPASIVGAVAGLLVLVLLLVVVLLNRADPTSSSSTTAEPTYESGRTVVSDTFERKLSSGWGSADVGGPYTLSEPSGFQVTGGSGVMALDRPGSTRVATLSSMLTSDFAASVDLVAPGTVQRGNGVYVALHLRTNGQYYYRVVVRFAADRKAYLSISRYDGSPERGLVLANDKIAATRLREGQRLTLAVSVRGAAPVQVSASVRSGSGAPVEVAATDSSASQLASGGPLALWGYLSGGSDGPQAVGFDNLNVRQLQVVADVDAGGPGSGATGLIRGPYACEPEGQQRRDAPVDPRSAGAGSPAIGSSRYRVPERAVFASPQGSRSGSGTRRNPYGSLQQAVDRAPDGATVVARGGTYHESVLLPVSKVVHLQSYPGEAVWLDGSSAVTGWRRAGEVWETRWTHDFDSSPTYTKGAEDLDEPGWNFLDPEFPMAAHPDQVWVDGTRQNQVRKAEEVRQGTFYVDRARRKLVLGSDPTRADVRASTLSKALTIVGAGDRVRGIGIRRYATSVWQLGAATVNNDRVQLSDMVFTDNATTGLSVFAADVQLSRLTSLRNGLLGFHANQADRLRARGLWAGSNNVEHFNRAPVAGGMKLTSSRHVRVTGSEFSDNEGHGLWFDASSYDLVVTGSRAERNTGAGFVVEISSRARLADNVLLDNGGNGLLVINTDRVEVANNTLARNRGTSLKLVVADGRSQAHPGLGGPDPRRPGDPAMIWVSRDVSVYNNVLAGGGSGEVCVVDYSAEPADADLRLRLDHNYYAPAGTTSFAQWPSGQKSPYSYPDLHSYRVATDQDGSSRSVDGSQGTVVDRRGAVAETVRAAAAEVARRPSAAVADVVGRPGGATGLGAWQR